MTCDPLFMPFKDKPSTNPRYEALYKILGRVNDKLRTNDVVVTVHNDSSDDDIVKRVNSTDENAVEYLLNELRKRNGGPWRGQGGYGCFRSGPPRWLGNGLRTLNSGPDTRNFISGEVSRRLENNMCCPCDKEKESTCD